MPDCQPARYAIAVVLTEAKERHAILTVVTDHGDFVLDSFSDQVLALDRQQLCLAGKTGPQATLGLGPVERRHHRRPSGGSRALPMTAGSGREHG